MSDNSIRKYSIVRHLKSDVLYRVCETPDDNNRLEYCNEPYYVYKELGVTNGIKWIRRKSEFEDGRFTTSI